MTRTRFLLCSMLCAALAMPAVAEPGRYAITAERIAAAMAALGMQISPAQVMLLTNVVANTSDPVLRVKSLEQWGDHRVMVRMECTHAEECLPFIVALHLNQGGTPGGGAPAGSVQTASAPVDRPAPAFVRTQSSPLAYAVRVGKPAILLLDGDHIHIRIAVVCLENGSTGQTIRVSSPDHKQFYTAEVIDNSVLRGRL